MNLIEIADPDDERITDYRDIRERDLVGRAGKFIAEGRIVLGVLAAATDYVVESVLVLRRRLDAIRNLGPALNDVPVYVVEDEIMQAIAGFNVHRGVLAIGRPRTTPRVEDILAALPDRALVVVCVGISNHDNIGSIFRNAAAFGCGAILLDQTCCDPLYRKSLRVSVGGVFKVPFARVSDAQEVETLLANAGFSQFALTPAGRMDISHVVRQPRSAIYLGSEGDGLPDQMLRRMETVRIPIALGFDSLNVAAASAIALHYLAELP